MNYEKAVWLDSTVLNKSGLTINFDSDHAKYTFQFPCLSPVRIIDEGYRLGLWEKVKNLKILGKSPTWIVNHSDFIEQLDLNGEWNHANPSRKHYLSITPDIVIDVLSAEQPKMSKQNK